MSDMVPEVLNAALDSLFTPKEPGELEYQGDDGLLYCRNCHTPVQCRVKLWGRDKIVPCLCRCQQEAMAEKKRQDELVERQRKIRQLKATGIQEKHLLEWNFAVAEDNKDIQMAKRYVEQWKKVKAENLGLLLWGDVGTGKSFVAACKENLRLSGHDGKQRTFRTGQKKSAGAGHSGFDDELLQDPEPDGCHVFGRAIPVYRFVFQLFFADSG